MADKLRPKYELQRVGPLGDLIGSRMKSTDPEDIDSPFVLMPRKDPAAFLALLTYSVCCELDLATEIQDWLIKIAEAEPKYGTQGARNHIFMKKNSILEAMKP